MAAKDLYEKDFYKILGVDKKASADEIKKKYRSLARDLHPDKTQGDAALEEKFKAVSEAYDILSDSKISLTSSAVETHKISLQISSVALECAAVLVKDKIYKPNQLLPLKNLSLVRLSNLNSLPMEKQHRTSLREFQRV